MRVGSLEVLRREVPSRVLCSSGSQLKCPHLPEATPPPPCVSISLCLSPQPPSKPWSLQMPLVSPAGPGGSSSWDGSSSISKGHGESSPAAAGGTLGLPQPTICVPAPIHLWATRHGWVLLQTQARYLLSSCLILSPSLPQPTSLLPPFLLPPSLLQPPSSSPSPLCLQSRSGWAAGCSEC